MNFTTHARIGAILLCALLGACASKQDRGYGLGAQAEHEATLERTNRESALPDTPGMYLALIDKMQSEGMFYASLAHIDAYEKRFNRSADSTLRRADALRQTGQAAASRAAYEALLSTPLAARGYRGLGLLSGQSGDFDAAAAQFAHASDLAPTDAPILSDLGYALLRAGDVEGARVPLMKASELAPNSTKTMSNVALYLLASGQAANAQSLMTQQKFSPNAQQAIADDAKRVADAARSHRPASMASAAL
ncbi:MULTISPECIES: tetratricopeptide repeat protein [unclassified Caballeronia]|uniref:tetratricopeptide repeat protein n=1 Tax=unclassified Caballeronia TaxID=2646786 RepID=UPI0020278877|nr:MULTISPECIES: tetratricopeptide repeat protein [unclassified Caballeronia]MDR5773653.1 tetratricopeptide repeat protein [Caballeronia sp. LZ002]MDR5849087.1 tetratricopeptide repeat protein [Caballeronia sp. LZ003]